MRADEVVRAAEAGAQAAVRAARLAQRARSGRADSGAAVPEEDVAAFIRSAVVGAVVGAALAGLALRRLGERREV